MMNFRFNLFKRFSLCLLVLAFPSYLYGQIAEKILSKSDEIIIQLTNQKYFEQLRRPSSSYERNLLVSDEDSIRKSYFVPYSLKNTDKLNFYIGSDGSFTGAGMFIELDENLELLNHSYQELQAKLQLRAYHLFKSRNFIPRKDAEVLANKHFSNNYKKPFENYMLIYDPKVDSLIWRFDKFKGFRNYTVERIYFNAETGTFNKKESLYFRRNFWRALFLFRFL